MSSRRRLVLTGLVVLVLAAVAGPVLLFVAGGRSTAAFGDREGVGVNHLGAATLDLELGEQSANLVAANLAPGDMAVGWLDLSNAGDLPLRYAIVADNEPDLLLDALRWSVWPGRDCASAPAVDRLLRTDVALTAGIGVRLLGDAGFGLDAGDRILEPGEGERICITASLPIDAPNAVQGRSISQDLRILAEHHVGNPAR